MAPRSRRRAGAAAAILGAALLGGCLLPQGKPVIVDSRAGRFWTGDGVLLEVSPDRQHCRIAARGRSLWIDRKWVPCKYVHERTPS